MKNKSVMKLTPWQYMLTFRYLLSNYWIMLGIVLSMLIIFHLRAFTYPETFVFSFSDHVVIQWSALIIHIILIIAIVTFALFIARIQIERLIARTITKNCESEIIKINRPGGIRPDIRSLNNQCIPDEVSETSDMYSLFRRIQIDAIDRKYESVPALLLPYQDNYFSRLNTIVQFQKFALTLGILGTFVGLLLAIGSLETTFGSFRSIAGQNQDFIKQLLDGITQASSNLFQSLRLAFRTSIAGLEVFVVLGMLLLYAKKELRKFFVDIDNAAGHIISLARKASNKDDIVANLEGLGQSLGELQDQMESNLNANLITRECVENRIKEQTSTIEDGLKRMKDVVKDYDAFFETIKAREDTLTESLATRDESLQNQMQKWMDDNRSMQNEFINRMKEIYDLAAMKNLGQQLQDIVQSGFVELSSSIENSVNQTIEKFDTLHAKYTEMINETEEFTKGNTELLKDHTNNFAIKMESFQKDFSDVFNTFLVSQKHAVADIKKTSEKIVDQTSNISDKLESELIKSVKSMATTTEHLDLELKKISKKTLVSILEDADKVSTNVSAISRTTRVIPDNLSSVNKAFTELKQMISKYHDTPHSQINHIAFIAGKIVVYTGVGAILAGALKLLIMIFF